MRIVKIMLAAALIWSLYWALGAWGLRTDIAGWFTEQERQGWLAEHGGLHTGGYPHAHEVTIRKPVLADPGTGTAWSADWLTLRRAALPRGNITLLFPATAQHLSRFDKTVSLEAADMAADLDLAPGSALLLDGLRLQSGAWNLSHDKTKLISGTSLSFNMESAEEALTYRFYAQADGIEPRPGLRRVLAMDGAERAGIEILATIEFDSQWDRAALELRRPQPHRISVQRAALHHGRFVLSAMGTIDLDESGWPTGRLEITVRKWSDLLRLARATGLLAADSSALGERILRLLGTEEAGHEELTVTLTLEEGRMYLGPLPLGPAPRIVLP